MNARLTETAVDIAEFKENPSAAIQHAGEAPVAILQHNRATAYLVSAHRYEAMMDILDDLALAEIVKQRLTHINDAETVSLEELESAARAKVSTQVSARRA